MQVWETNGSDGLFAQGGEREIVRVFKEGVDREGGKEESGKSMTTKTRKQKPYKRTGTAVKGGEYYPYPKRWEIVIEPDAEGTVRINRKNENFNAYELYGHLRLVVLDLERQLSYKTLESELLEKQEVNNGR